MAENILSTKFKGDPFLGCGVSIGSDRLAWAIEQKNNIKSEEKKPVLVCIMQESQLDKYYELLKVLRDNNIASEIYLESKKKLSKQLEYASKRGLSLAIICGDDEFKDNTVTFKNLQGIKGENQITIPKENLVNEIKNISNILKSSGFKNIELDSIIESNQVLKKDLVETLDNIYSLFMIKIIKNGL